MSISKTRQKLVDVARQLFAKNGINNTTMNDIAQASGKGRRTLYTYFKSKEDVYYAVIESELERLSDKLDEVASMKMRPQDKIIELIYTHLNMIKETVVRNGNLRAEFFRNIWMVEKVRKNFDEDEIELFRKVYSEAKEDGEFDIENVELVADITPFEDNMMILELTEKQIIDAIKVGVKSLRTGSKPGIMLVSGMKYTCDKKGNLISAEFIDKNGNSHTINVNNPSETKKYTVATDDFIATGGDNYFPTNQNPDYVVQTFYLDKNKLACDYLKKFNEPIEIKSDGRVNIID